MSEEMFLVGAAAFVGGFFLLMNHFDRQCPKCRRLGARLRGKRELVDSNEESHFEWQSQEVAARYREHESDDGVFGARISRSRESYHEDVKYEVKTRVEYYGIPCSCRFGCGHLWTEKLPPEKHTWRERVG